MWRINIYNELYRTLCDCVNEVFDPIASYRPWQQTLQICYEWERTSCGSCWAVLACVAALPSTISLSRESVEPANYSPTSPLIGFERADIFPIAISLNV